MKSCFLAALIAFVGIAAPAVAVELDGNFIQGGMVIGQTVPGSQVSLNGKAVRVSGDGLFVLGFGRDAGEISPLLIRLPDGTTERKELNIQPQTYKIQRIDGLPKRKVTPKPADLKRIKSDNAEIAAVRRLDTDRTYFMSRFQWPVTGRISGVFGSQRILNGKPRSPHNGVDIAAPKGTPVRASAAGVVALVHQDMFYTGKTVMIDHGHRLSSVYIHMSVITVKVGQVVEKGQAIGKVGMTGRATGPHLHWGLSLAAMPLDPALAAGPM